MCQNGTLVAQLRSSSTARPRAGSASHSCAVIGDFLQLAQRLGLHRHDFVVNHLFFQQLQGGEHKWERLLGALEALTDTRLKEYLAAVPNEWRSNNAAADRISEYLQDARENRDPLFAVINRLLK